MADSGQVFTQAASSSKGVNPFAVAIQTALKRKQERDALNTEFEQAKTLARFKSELNKGESDPFTNILKSGKAIDSLEKIDPEGKNPETVRMVQQLQKFGLGAIGKGETSQPSQNSNQFSQLNPEPQIKRDQSGEVGLNLDPKLLGLANKRNVFGDPSEDIESEIARETLKKQSLENVPEKLSDKQLEMIKEDVNSINALTSNMLFFKNNIEEFSDLLGPIGTAAPIRRFASKFSKEGGSEQAFISAVEQTNQVSVRALTGAQAGFTELQFLRGIHPTVDDKPQAFLNKSYFTAQTTVNGLKRQIPLLKESGRDVRGVENILKSFDEQLKVIESIIEPEELNKLRIEWQDEMNEMGIELTGEGRAVIMTDAKGNKALVDPDTNQVIREL